MANEVTVTTQISVNSSVAGITRRSRVLETYEADLGDFDTPEDTGSATINTAVTDLDVAISASFTYATGDIIIITNTGDTNYVDIAIEDQGTNKNYYARLKPQQHMHMPLVSGTNLWAKTASGSTTVRVTVVQTA